MEDRPMKLTLNASKYSTVQGLSLNVCSWLLSKPRNFLIMEATGSQRRGPGMDQIDPTDFKTVPRQHIETVQQNVCIRTVFSV
jgi:hypothetical protein